MLETVNLICEGDGRTRLSGCTLSVRTGEVLGIVGATGSGKSSILAVLAGQLAPSRGQVLLNGRDVGRKSGALAKVVGYMAHEIPGPLDLSCQAWLKFWLEVAGVPKTSRQAAISDALKRFPSFDLNRRVSACSWSERRLLDLIRVFGQKPKLYLLDCPSQALDGHGLRALTTAIKDVAADGATVILAESSPHLPVAVCDRALVMQGGKVVADVKRGQGEFESMIARSQGWSE
jgi:ABC-type multidrug transport system ATPase subunit